MQRKAGKPAESCWYGEFCPFEEVLRTPRLARVYDFARRSMELRDVTGAKSTNKRQEYIPTREAFQYACWYYNVATPELRMDAEHWVAICVTAANEGLRGERETHDAQQEEADLRMMVEEIARKNAVEERSKKKT